MKWCWVWIPLGLHIGACRLGESLDEFTSGAMAGASGFSGSTGGSGASGGEGGIAGSTGGEGGIAGSTGGEGGIGGAAGATGGSGGCPTGCGTLEECGKNGYCVAKSVAMPGGYSVDATQVTRSQYDAWLSTNPLTGGQAAFCEWDVNFQPSCEWPPEAKGYHPVVCVDWCDAYAYCQAIGKRLCGRISGGGNDYGDYADASKSQWYAACSSGGNYDFPYGNTFEAKTCNGKENGLNMTSEVGTLADCQSSASGYEGVYDMSGNVWEWEDSCDVDTGQVDSCRTRGGSFSTSDVYNLRCGHGAYFSRNNRAINIGFRCCSL